MASKLSSGVLELDVEEYFSGPSKTTFIGTLADVLFPASPPIRFFAAWLTPITALIAIHPLAVLHCLGLVVNACTNFSPALQALCQNLNQPFPRWLIMAVLSSAGLLFSFVIVPLLDWLTGEEGPAGNQPSVPEWHQAVYRFILHGYVALHLLVLASAAHVAATAPLSPLSFLLLVLNVACSGAVGFTTAHELIHSKHKADRVIADVLLTCMCYVHWAHSHIAHHKQVATPDDPASARYKESVYQFIPRSIVGNWRDALRMERERLAQKGLSYPWCLQNRVISWIAAPACVAAAVYAAFGANALLLHLSAAAGSIFFLETINYIEHYGLQRQQLPGGKFESVSEHHSWNANTFFANSAYFRLQRHTHHHMHASKPYWALENVEGAPKLPGSYPTMILLALLPPVFFTVMNPRVHIYQLLADLSGTGSARSPAVSSAAAP